MTPPHAGTVPTTVPPLGHVVGAPRDVTTAPATGRARADEAPATSHRREQLLVVAGVLLVALTLRTAVTSASPLLGSVRHDLGFGAAALGLIGLLPTACFALFGAFTPAVGRRVGLERLLVVAMALAAGGQTVRAVAPSTTVYLLGSVVALAGMGAGNVLLPPLIKRYLPEHTGVMTGLYSMCVSLSTALPPALAAPVAHATGSAWRVPVAVWAVPAVVAVLPWLPLLRRAGRPAADDAAVVGGSPWARPVWHSRTAWGMAAMFGMTSLNTYSMFAWLPQIFTDAGLPVSRAGMLLAVYAGVGLPVSLLVPWLAVRLRNPLPLVLVGLACFGVGYGGLLTSPTAAPVLWAAAAGVGPLCFPLSLALIGLRSRTPGGAAALSGFGQGVGYAVAGAGPLLFGLLREATGSWTAPFVLLFASLVVQVTGAVVICRPRAIEDDLVRPPSRRMLRRLPPDQVSPPAALR